MRTLDDVVSSHAGLAGSLVDLLTMNRYDTEEDRSLRDSVLRGYTLGTLLLARAAERDGAEVEWLNRSLCVATPRGGPEVLIRSHRCSESVVASAVQRDKHLTSEVLRQAGVSVPENIAVSSGEEAVEAWKTLDGPAVVKPRSGFKGKGITVGVDSADQIRDAYALARTVGASVVVEEFVDGDEFRFIGSADEGLSVLARIRPHVIGDGESTVEQLIAVKNRLRRANPHACNRLIPINSSTRDYLSRSGRSLQDTPGVGEFVGLLGVANFSQGADALECSDAVAQEIRNTGTAAVAALPGLPWAAVDILVSRTTGRPYVLEVNTDGGLGGHAFPSFGVPHDVAPVNWSIQRRYAERVRSGQMTSALDAPEGKVSPTSRDGRGDWATFDNVRLSRYARRYMARSGHRPQRVSDRLYRVPGLAPDSPSTDGSGTLWLNGALTLADKHSVVEAASRFLPQRSLMERRGVPAVPGRSAQSEDECVDFLTQFGPATAVTWRGDWHGSTAVAIEHSSDLSGINWERVRGVWIQERPKGRRVRVLADREYARTVFLVDGGDGDAAHVLEHLDEVGAVAVSAVRAVPELRWASVDLVLPETSSDEPGVVVEGMTLNPWLPKTLHLLAGDLECFFASIFPVATSAR